MALGVAKEIDDTFKIATAGLLEWLRHDYHLSLIESMQVMSTSIEFDIAEIADSEIVVVAKIRKEILSRLKKRTSLIRFWTLYYKVLLREPSRLRGSNIAFFEPRRREGPKFHQVKFT